MDDAYPDLAECIVAVLLSDLQLEPNLDVDERQQRWIRVVRAMLEQPSTAPSPATSATVAGLL